MADHPFFSLADARLSFATLDTHTAPPLGMRHQTTTTAAVRRSLYVYYVPGKLASSLGSVMSQLEPCSLEKKEALDRTYLFALS